MNTKSADLDIQDKSQNDSHHKKSLLQVVRTHCLSCCCESPKEVRLCPAVDCNLHPYRLGKNPFRKPRVLTEKQRQEMVNRMKGVIHE